jgi:spindle assembly abnormal protein 6
MLRGNNERLQQQLEASIKEINKGNSIIARQQAERRDTRSKVRLKSAVVKEQERLLDERQQQLQDAERRERGLRAELESLRAEATAVGQQRDDAREKLEESKAVLAQNQKVISWLNTELNQAKAISKGVAAAGKAGTAAHSYSPEQPSVYAGLPIAKKG